MEKKMEKLKLQCGVSRGTIWACFCEEGSPQSLHVNNIRAAHPRLYLTVFIVILSQHKISHNFQHLPLLGKISRLIASFPFPH